MSRGMGFRLNSVLAFESKVDVDCPTIGFGDRYITLTFQPIFT